MNRRFLLIGLDPHSIDYSAPHLPPGASAERLVAMVDDIRRQFADQGDRCDLCSLQPELSAEKPVTQQLTQWTYDCILIGGGLQRPEMFPLLERIINSIHRHASDAAIGFMALPKDGLETVARVLSQDFKRAGLIPPSAPLDAVQDEVRQG